MASKSSSSSQKSSGNLQRGQACFNCRRRKMRCDGARPICGQCEKANRPDDCEYTNGQKRARAEILQEDINRVESRIFELEHPQRQAQPVILLHRPHESGLEGPVQPHHMSSIEEPPLDMVEKLIDAFLPYSSEFGFFLNAPRFRKAALKPHPVGHPTRPSPAVLTTVSLWGLRLSKWPHLVSQDSESVFLSRALKLTANGLSGSHPQKIMHNLQAEILLAYYFFASGRFLEGKYHTTAAISLALSSSIYMVRSAMHAGSPGPLPPVSDSVEEGERIHACWISMVLDKLWAVSLNETPNLDHQNETCRVDTPWPLEMEDYGNGRLSPTALYSSTIQKFIGGLPTSDTGMSTLAMLSKATILWQRAAHLSSQWKPDMLREQTSVFRSSFSSLDSLIDNFRAALIPPNRFDHPTPAMTRTLVIAHSIAHAATMKLHTVEPLRTDTNARRKRLAAAQTALEIIVSVPLTHFSYINPIMGTVWLDAFQVLVDEISFLRKQHMGRTGEETGLMTLLTRTLDVLTNFVGTCPLLS
ncbi:hypothetical protein B0H11DRAFT_2277116 [Mycena galericulata]|nr:hypothetical protein B0H11DRAFT_2277116 [Mycena galericulata]